MTTKLRPTAHNTKKMTARFAGVCPGCDRRFPVGTEITFDKDDRKAWHDRCWNDAVADDALADEHEADRGGWTGAKAEQWAILAELNEYWDGEWYLTEAEAKNFHEQWEAGVWKLLDRPEWWS